MTEDELPSNLLTIGGEDPTDVPDSVPFTNVRVQTSKIIDNFLVNDNDSAQYMSSKKWAYWARGKATILFFVAYFSAVVIGVALNQYTGLSESIRNVIVGSIFGVSILCAAGFWSSKKIFSNRAKKTGISYADAVYHEAVSAIDDFQKEKYDYSINHLKRLRELLKFDKEDEHPFDSNFQSDLNDYLKQINKGESSDFLQDTFPPIADAILRYLVIAQYSDFSRQYSEEDEVDSTTEFEWHDHIRSYFGGVVGSPYVRRIGPYIVIAPVILAIALVYNPAWANIVAILSLGIVEGYHRVIKEED